MFQKNTFLLFHCKCMSEINGFIYFITYTYILVQKKLPKWLRNIADKNALLN